MVERLDAVKFGIAGGAVTALAVALITIGGIYGYLGNSMNLISDWYGAFGYSVTWLGVLLGGVYSFIDGFILTWIFAWIYNKLL